MDTVVPEATKYRFERNKRNGSRGDYLYSYHDSSLPCRLRRERKEREREKGEIKRGRRPLLKIDGTTTGREKWGRQERGRIEFTPAAIRQRCDKRCSVRVSSRTKGRYFLRPQMETPDN